MFNGKETIQGQGKGQKATNMSVNMRLKEKLLFRISFHLFINTVKYMQNSSLILVKKIHSLA